MVSSQIQDMVCGEMPQRVERSYLLKHPNGSLVAHGSNESRG